jgi:hypothetical protein
MTSGSIAARLERLERATAGDWRAGLPAGVTVQQAEALKSTMARIWANYALEHDLSPRRVET